MTEKLRPCPFCGGEAKIQLTDSEGNGKSESYLENPYSGVGYVIVHDISNSADCCPIATDYDVVQGGNIYTSKEEAINAWNGRTYDDLTNYISKVMGQFPNSFINWRQELILIPKTNLYVCLHDVNTPTDLKYKLLEWCSRDSTSSLKYSQHWRNRQYQDSVLMRINICLGTSFTREEMMMIYQRLGNCCNHKLTMKFVSSGYDMKLLEEK